MQIFEVMSDNFEVMEIPTVRIYSFK